MNGTTPDTASDAPRPLVKLAMTFGAPLLLAGVTAVGIATTPAADHLPSPVVEQTQKYDDALQALTEQRYSVAYGRFAALADQGHAPAALMALAMVTYPPTRVDPQWSATPGQLRRWTTLAMDEVRARTSVIARNERGE